MITMYTFLKLFTYLISNKGTQKTGKYLAAYAGFISLCYLYGSALYYFAHSIFSTIMIAHNKESAKKEEDD